MAKLFKVTDVYIVDPMDWYENEEALITDMFEDSEYTFPATTPHAEFVEFEWDDDCVFNTFGCSPIDCEMLFNKQEKL